MYRRENEWTVDMYGKRQKKLGGGVERTDKEGGNFEYFSDKEPNDNGNHRYLTKLNINHF